MPIAKRKERWTPDVVRQRIRTGMLINRLQKHVGGRLNMTPTQISAAGILLRKTLPDMVAAQIEKRPLEAMADDELLSTLKEIRSYLASTEPGTGMEPTPERESAH